MTFRNLKHFCSITVFLALISFAGIASAALTTIGTATYNGNDYNLIWDDDNNGHSVIWLDYSNTADGNWATHTAWAASLTSQLVYHFDPAYQVSWEETSWRLPASQEMPYQPECNGSYIYRNTTSEMGHLFYSELGNRALNDTNCNQQSNHGLVNTGPFQNLTDSREYWSSTGYSESGPARTADSDPYAWLFNMDLGGLRVENKGFMHGIGLAIRYAQVTPVNNQIPTLSEWGEIIMVLLLAGSAIYVYNRRKFQI